MLAMDGSQLLLLSLGILFSIFSFVVGVVVLICMVLKHTHRPRVVSRGRVLRTARVAGARLTAL